MDPATIAFLGSLGLKGLSALFGGKSKKKKNAENRKSTINALTLRQKQSEDARRARLQLANSILSRVPGTTAGGRVNTGVALDPAIFEALNKERTYDFASAVPDENVGGFTGFLEGLFGGAADTVPYMFGRANAAGGPSSGGHIQGLTLEDLMRLQRTQGDAPKPPNPALDDWME